MEQVWVILGDFLTQLATFTNVGILVATWVIIWALERPIRLLVELLPSHKQVAWWRAQKAGKQIAGICWCSVAVWIPSFQPKLCLEDVVAAPGCQSVADRIIIGIVLGGSLTFLHKFVLSKLKRMFGMGTKVPIEVTKTSLAKKKK